MLAGNLSQINSDTVKLRLHNKKPDKRRKNMPMLITLL